MQERLAFVQDALSDRFTMAELCARYASSGRCATSPTRWSIRSYGLEETDDGVWAIYFNTVLLGTLDERDYIIRG